ARHGSDGGGGPVGPASLCDLTKNSGTLQNSRRGRLRYIYRAAFMRTIHWIFLVSVLLFVSGIAFTIAGAREARKAPAAAAAPSVDLAPVASVKQIMKAITGPAT